MDAVRGLFREYAAWLSTAWAGPAICFDSFERELAELPRRYSPVFVAVERGELAGCAALREIGDGVSEMKRLYVRPAFQGLGLGRLLVQQVATEARATGYRFLRLDTLPVMNNAIRLYRTLGFREIPPYGDNPAEAICFELAL
jgi:ribosomal protein S18 acetylase RimI-like enzyme